MPSSAPAAKADDKPSVSNAANYVDRLGEMTKWAVGALAAAGTFAVTKMSFDRLGEGDYSDGRALWAFASLLGFALGIAILVVAVVWNSRANRVTLGYLRTSKHGIGKNVRESIEASPYLLDGETKLDDFVQRLNVLVAERGADPAAFQNNDTKRRQLALLVRAKQDALDTARAERASRVNRWASVLFVVASVIVTLGASTYGYVTNRAIAIEKENKAEVAASLVRPVTPANVALAVPKDDPKNAALVSALGADCDTNAVLAIVVEVANPPAGFAATSVMHAITEKTTKCNVVDTWVPPSLVVARAAPAPAPAAAAK